MSSLPDNLKGYSDHVFVDPNDQSGSFRLNVRLLGKRFHTSPTLTRQVKESSEFDQLSGAEQAIRILELVLAHAQQ
jgi:hypothetical protein